MDTEIFQVHPDHPEPDGIARAAAVLRGGGLVAFPTETVYGLGANALDAAAVERIFVAKERPARNPLIVHVADIAAARSLAGAWRETAERLARRFWPGPLTLVVPTGKQIPSILTAGGATVALRVPAHPVPQALLQACALPIAAPSANRSSRLSPTRAQHVLRDLNGRIDMLLDAGPTAGGLESTILDVTVTPPRLLRPGLLTPAQLEEIIGPIARPGAADHQERERDEPLPAPGMLPRHYAPRTPLECVPGNGARHVEQLCDQGLRVGWLTFAEPAACTQSRSVIHALPANAAAYAAQLYAALHALDDAGLDRIVVDLPPPTDEWLAIHDRLRRASTPP
jgi:L-threonylcarbamoyladenylate synthase